MYITSCVPYRIKHSLSHKHTTCTSLHAFHIASSILYHISILYISSNILYRIKHFISCQAFSVSHLAFCITSSILYHFNLYHIKHYISQQSIFITTIILYHIKHSLSHQAFSRTSLCFLLNAQKYFLMMYTFIKF